MEGTCIQGEASRRQLLGSAFWPFYSFSFFVLLRGRERSRTEEEEEEEEEAVEMTGVVAAAVAPLEVC